MDKMINSSTIYDVLSAIIPGYLICFLFQLLFVPKGFSVKGFDNLSSGVILFVTSYLVGLLFKTILEYLFSPILKNRTWLIKRACKASEIDEQEKKEILDENDEAKLKRKYYFHYYKAVNNNVKSSIGTIEMQIAFVRSMSAIILLYMFVVPKVSAYFELCCNYGLTLFIGLLFLEILILALVFYLQFKVHKLVWEDSFYARETNCDLKNNKE